MEITLSGADSVVWGGWTPEKAAEFLREERVSLRTFSETLRMLYPLPDLQERLIGELLAYQDCPSPESTLRKVRNWLTDRHMPTDREEIFRIGFALKLPESSVNRLLGQCTGSGIHYRDGRDVIYAWFLRAMRPYPEARDFFAALPPIRFPEAPLPAQAGTNVTHELQRLFLAPTSTEELRALYISKLASFGSLHMRAYRYLDQYMRVLQRPVTTTGGSGETHYSVEEVTDLYLQMGMPRSRLRGELTVTQKLIKHNWPNPTYLKNICARREDVPRKLLLLLYVVTENVVDSGYSELDEPYISASERFEQHWWTLNAILNDCGMPVLDPRDPTDWLTLYALSSDDQPMSERMAEVIEKLFSN